MLEQLSAIFFLLRMKEKDFYQEILTKLIIG
jgi:hypothetical protein